MNEIKIIDAGLGIVEVLAAPFSGPLDGRDLEGETFTAATDFGPDVSLPVLYDHGDPELGVIGTVTERRVDNVGLWMRLQLDRAHKYFSAVMELLRRGALGVSTGAKRGETRRDKLGKIITWPLAELSLTPQPANPWARPVSVKSLHYETERGNTIMTMSNTTADVRRLLRGIDFDLDVLDVKALARRGYDSDGDVISYKGAALWPAEALTPAEHEPVEVKAFRQRLRVALDQDYQRAFERFLGLAFRLQSDDAAFAQLSTEERKALTEGSDTGGGFLVPADVAGQMLARMAATAVVRPRAQVIPTVRDKLTVPAFGAHATQGSVYTSGFVGTWAPEVPVFSDTDPAIGTFEASVKKLRVGTKVSRDLAEDAGGVGWLTSNGADNLTAAEDRAFLIGAVPTEPAGILPALPAANVVDVEGTTVQTISNTTAADGSASKLLTFAATLPSQYQRDAVLVLDAATEASVNKLVDAQRRFLFERRKGAAGRRELLGFPAENSPHMPLEGTDANRVLLVGDFSGYIVAPRSLLTIVLGERFADTEQIGVVLVDRVAAGVHNVDAFRAGAV